MSKDDNDNNDGDDAAEGQLDSILSLVMARSRGEVGNDAVESALSCVVPSTTASRRGVVRDTDDYDFDDDTKPPAVDPPTDPVPKITAERASDHPSSQSLKRYDASMGRIPLGKMGSRMLITFGDGPRPRPEVVSAALGGTRSSLQRAVLDARALYR